MSSRQYVAAGTEVASSYLVGLCVTLPSYHPYARRGRASSRCSANPKPNYYYYYYYYYYYCCC